MVQLGASASTSQDEPQWAWDDALEGYSRPLLGAELVMERMHVFSDGAPEPCHGFTFQTIYDHEDLLFRLRSALAHLRFTAPLVAASIEDDHYDPGRRVWVYRSPSKEEDVQQWVTETLIVHQTESSDEDFIAAINQTRLPFEDGRFTKLFECHLLVRESGIHSMFIHASHALLDPIATLSAFREIFDYMSCLPPHTAFADHAWGQEWRKLPVGPIASTGGIRPGAGADVPSLLRDVESLTMRDKPSEALQAQRTDICHEGLPVRVHSIIPANKFSALKAQLKQLDLSVTVLLEAAFVLTTFAHNARQRPLSADAHVLLDMTMIALNPLFIPPHNSNPRVGASVSYVPLLIDFKDIPKDKAPREVLLSVMTQLRAQYRKWVLSPHFPYLSYQYVLPTNPNPSALVLADIGIIEDHIPTQWPRNVKRPTIELLDMSLGHRLAAFPRPVAHAWSLNGELHVQISASDIWGKSVLANFLHESLDLALFVTENLPPLPNSTPLVYNCAAEHAATDSEESRLELGLVSNWGRRMARFLGLRRIV